MPIPPDFYPTPFTEVNAILAELLTGVQSVLGPNFTGLYLYGSLASGGFDPRTSDIDFAVITTSEITSREAAGLERLHQQLWQSGSKWALKLEGSYVPKHVIRRHKPSKAIYPTVNEGSFYLGELGSDWIIQRHILRECGVVVLGPAPQTFIDPVPPEAIRESIISFLREWWLPMLTAPQRLATREYQAYAALTMCRALYTLQNNAIVSKVAAARWARSNLKEKWVGLIDQALSWPEGDQPDRINDTLELIQLTVRHAGIKLK
jgi:predicted nucleotidyltransferase